MASQVLHETRDVLTARRVYAEPYEKNGSTVIPAASVRGGGGGGGGESPEGKGEGGGFGVSARPTGAWVIKGDDVRWKPALDVTRIAIIGELVALAGVFAWRSAAVAGAKRRPVLARMGAALPRPRLPHRRAKRLAFVRNLRPNEWLAVDGHVPFVHVGR
ncbi:MAG TPA: spore germination protein GerW family protein [Gaiellaceae bacterium]|nr:spore germination protein GerW family protein [Gaiellaceae bacterium]